MWRQSTPKNPKAGRTNRVYYVYDISTTMTDFCASFAVYQHAKEWGEAMFGEKCYVSDVRLHKDGCIWNGKKETR